MGADEVEIEMLEQIVRSVTSTGTNDGGNGGIGESSMQVGEALVDRAREIRGMLTVGVLGGDGIVAKLAQLRDAARNARRLRAGCG